MNRRPAALLVLSATFAALSFGSATVIAKAEVERCHGTTYTLQSDRYNIEVLQIGGCTTAARQEFNDAARLAADNFLATYGNDTTINTNGRNYMYIGSHIISAKIGVEVYSEGAAHGFDDFVTHNTAIDTGEALTLTDLFTDLDEGLDILHNQSKVILDNTPRASGYDPSAITADAENFQNWIATKDGMRVYFGEIASHAAGNIDITIPWVKLERALKPEMKTVLTTP